MLKDIKREIREGIFGSKLRFLRHMGILLIPLFYGFLYIFAFFDPFEKSDALDLTIVTIGKKDSKGVFKSDDPLSERYVNDLVKEKRQIKLGSVNFKTSFNHIYITQDQMEDTSFKNEESKKHYATFFIGQQKQGAAKTNLTKTLAKTILIGNDILLTERDSNGKWINIFDRIKNVASNIDVKNLFSFYTNYSKNYLIAMGMDFATSMLATYERAIDVFIKDPEILSCIKTEMNNIIKNYKNDPNDKDVVNNPQFKSTLDKLVLLNSGALDNKINKTISVISSIESGFEDKLLHGINVIHTNSQMEEHAKYGFGLAPFFISLAFWIGSMAIALSIYGKIYPGTKNIFKTFVAKLIVVWLTMFTSATILFLSLLSIGFTELGINALSLYITMIIVGWAFSTIVFCIRCMVPNRTAGILIVLILMIIQAVSSGGLFPTQSLYPVFDWIQPFMPYHYTVQLLRESIFDLNWGKYLAELFILFSFTSILTVISYFVWHKRKLPLIKESSLAKKSDDLANRDSFIKSFKKWIKNRHKEVK